MKKIFLIALLSILSSSAFARTAWVDNKAICEKTQGNWRLFNNDCGNSCESRFSLPICSAIPSYACDCGKNRCWDNDKCVSNKIAKKYWDQIAADNKAKRDEELAILKEQEDLYYKDNKVANAAAPDTTQPSGGLAGETPVEPTANSETPPIGTTPEIEQKKQVCDMQKGVWKQFKNGCVDNCNNKMSTISMCTSALTFGCECGETKCWDDTKSVCVEIEDYKKLSATQMQTPPPSASSPIVINNPITSSPANNSAPNSAISPDSMPKTDSPKSDNSFQPNSLGQPNLINK